MKMNMLVGKTHFHVSLILQLKQIKGFPPGIVKQEL